MRIAVRTTPLSATFGVEVHGVDLTEPIAPDLGAELRALFFRHRLLVFRGQDFEAEHQIAFMSLISKVITEPERSVLESAAIPVEERFKFLGATAAAQREYEQLFHADFMFTPQGAIQAISLYATVMERAAPTHFANMVDAAASLPVELRERVTQLLVDNLQGFSPSDYRGDRRCRMSNRKPGEPNSWYPHAVHPVIERHPVTGEEYLDVSQLMTSHVVGWDDDSSDRLFEELDAVSYSPENIYSHAWRIHDFVVWDNIALQHKRGSIPGEGLRTLRRVLANPYELGSLYAAAEQSDWEPTRQPGEPAPATAVSS